VLLQRYVLNPPMKDDPLGRLAHFPDAHARLVQRAGTSLLSIRFDL
jgi:hypothetical protein